jgi:hypothetical protein
MREEQQLAKLRLMKKKLDMQVEDDSESEVEFVEGDFGAVKRHRVKQYADSECPLKSQRLAYHVPPMFHSLFGSPTSPIVITEHPAVTSPTLAPEPTAHRPWPYGMFTINMVEGFIEMDKLVNLPVSEQFQEVFNEPFVASTYADQCHWWLRASQDAHDEALAGQCSARGLWGMFTRRVLLK